MTNIHREGSNWGCPSVLSLPASPSEGVHPGNSWLLGLRPFPDLVSWLWVSGSTGSTWPAGPIRSPSGNVNLWSWETGRQTWHLAGTVMESWAGGELQHPVATYVPKVWGMEWMDVQRKEQGNTRQKERPQRPSPMKPGCDPRRSLG